MISCPLRAPLTPEAVDAWLKQLPRFVAQLNKIAEDIYEADNSGKPVDQGLQHRT
jgi:hypothetical protein